MKTISPGADGGPVCKIRPLILTLDPCRGPKGALKKTWVPLSHMGQKAVIQDGVQDGRLKFSQSSD